MATIITQVNSAVDNYPSSQILEVGQSFTFVTTATLTDADITNSTTVSGISIQWQVSTDNGSTWNNLSNGGNTSIVQTTEAFVTTPVTYYRKSSLTVSNVQFSQNLYQYRSVVTYIGATNTPVNRPSILLLVDPTINITKQPGTGTDTLRSRCYKTSDNTSGKIKVEVNASTTANTSLNYSWEVNLGDPSAWYPINNVLQSYIAFLKAGTVSNGPVLELERVIFYNTIGFRCTITGVSTEDPVTSNAHYVYMEDVQVAPILESLTYDIVEDEYGDVVNRSSFVDSGIKNVTMNSLLDIARNTGINGDLSVIYERKDPGSLTWVEVGTSFQSTVTTGLVSYTQFPVNTPTYSEFFYTTPPLRRSTDNGAKYRLKISSSAIFNLNQTVKTIVPYYSSEITLNVYRTVYITNQPFTANVYPNDTASFSIGVNVSSGSISDVTYQWQYNTQNTTTGWVNIPNSSPYSGVTTSLLIVNPVPSNPTYRYFRCVVSVPNQISSVTSSVAELIIERDYFVEISSLNDSYINQFSTLNYQVTASSISQKQISYQWQKSTNYNPFTKVGTWNNITNQTTNSFSIGSAATTDTGYYRLRLTSFGGVVAFSNVVYVSVTSVNIQILKNIPTSLTVLEGDDNAYTFECEGFSTVGTTVNYQWQIRRTTDTTFQNIGSGFNNSSDNTRIYAPRAFDRINDTGARIRCVMTAQNVPFEVYTNECLLTVNRKFSYFADAATKTITIGSTLVLDLTPSWTGGTPTFMWQESTNGGTTWTDLNLTDSSLSIPNMTNAFNGRRYRCRVTLTSISQIEYFRNGTTTLVAATSDTFFTVPVILSVVATASVPTYYSLQMQKTGAAIGTVIAVPKPDGYVNNSSANTDDVDQWRVAVTGSLTNSNTSSVVTSGAVYDSNRPSWAAATYTSPRWLLSSDRFSGYIEMRGQFLRARDFPELARMFGTTYGGTITGSYPNYGANDTFRMPNLYAKKLMGTGNVNNNRGAVSITPLYDRNGQSGGDKNVPGSVGGLYNYIRSAQLPAGSPGLAGEPDGTAGVSTPSTYALGSFRSSGVDEVNQFAQPTFTGSVSWVTQTPVESFTDTPLHNHQAVSVGWRNTQSISGNDFFGNYIPLTNGNFRTTRNAAGILNPGPTTAETGLSHGHGIDTNATGTFDMEDDAGMNISTTTLRMLNSSRQILDNSLIFYLRNNEEIPLNSAYFRLKYMIKAY